MPEAWCACCVAVGESLGDDVLCFFVSSGEAVSEAVSEDV